jgi:SpoVK/Ycf46/Vps4 family AAA+-type ATPase
LASSSVDKELETLIRARYPIIYIVSWEEQRVEDALREIARERGKKIFFWTITQGLVQNPNHRDNATKDPLNALDAVIDSRDQALFVLKDFHAFIADVTVTRRLRDLTAALKTSYKTLIILAPNLRLPNELEKEIAVIDYGLPDHDDLDVILEKVIQAVKDNPQIDCKLTELERDQVLKAAQGLTAMEAENVFAKSLIEKHKFDVDVVLGEKEQIIRKSGILEYYPFSENIADVGGLDLLKGWMEKRTVAFTEKARDFGLPAPRGVLLLGVQGCGKSLSAKAIGSLWRLPLLRLDVGRIFAGIVGSSEENMRKAIRVAESVAPCVAGDTRITLADGSERTIQSLYDGDERELQVMAMDDDWQLVPVSVKAITRRAAPDLYTVRLKHGQVQATGNHLHPVLRDGELHWVRTDELTTDDHVAVPRSIPTRIDLAATVGFLSPDTRLYFDGALTCARTEIQTPQRRYAARRRNADYVKIEELARGTELQWANIRLFATGQGGFGNTSLCRLPEQLNSDFGYLLGLIASDGFLGKRGAVGFVNTDLTLHRLFAELVQQNFGLCAEMRLNVCASKNTQLRGTSEKSVFRPCYTTFVTNSLLNRLLANIQAQLLAMPQEFLNAWLRGYFDGDGYISSDTAADPKIVLTSKRPAYNREIRAVLQRVGFAVTNPGSSNIEITGIRNVQRFITQIGSLHPCRRARMDAWMEKPPIAQEKDRTDMIPVGARLRHVRQALGMGSQHFINTGSSLFHRYEHNLGHPNRERLRSILNEMRAWVEARGGETSELDTLDKLVDSQITWSKVVSVTQEDTPEYVYDLACHTHHNFIANGVVTHNCLLWLDELEKGFSGTQSSGMSDGGTTSRVFGTFLTWMQDKKAPAFVVATSNDVTSLPPELLRKGRFDEIFFIDLPAHEERKQIFKIHLQKRKRDPENFDLDRLAEVTPGFSGAEIEAVVVDALYDAFDETGELTTDSIVAAAAHTVPLAMTMQERIENLRDWAATRARDASSVRAEDLETIKEQLLVAKANFNREHPEDDRAVTPDALRASDATSNYGSDLEPEED